MSYKDKIKKALHEGESAIGVTADEDNFDDVVRDVSKLKRQDSGLNVTVDYKSDSDKTNESEKEEEIVENDESQDVEVNADNYFEKKKLGDEAAEADAKEKESKGVVEVVGRMSKGKLEKLVEQNKKIGKAYKKIIKVSEIRTKNG